MSNFERWLVWTSAAATALTGLAFFWAKYLIEPAEPWAVVNHPLEPWFLKTHIVFAPVFVFAVGLIVTRHIVPHIKQNVRQGRRSGLVMVWTLIPMAVSGYLLQVVTATVWVKGLVILHLATGFLFLFGLAGHGIVLVTHCLWRAGDSPATVRAQAVGSDGEAHEGADLGQRTLLPGNRAVPNRSAAGR